MSGPIPDGNALIAGELPKLIDLIARTSLWVAPETFRALPVWAPWAARGAPLYLKGWRTPATNTRKSTGVTAPKHEGNVAALNALVRALDVPSPRPRNWTVCHIWGYDDPAFATFDSVSRDHRFFTCVANMIWLPTPLKGLTDAVPEVKAVLRACAAGLYGWHGPTQGMHGQTQIPAFYPEGWPQPGREDLRPVGTRSITPAIKAEIERRKRSIARDLEDATLEHYPRDAVRAALAYWKIDLSEAPAR